MINRTFCVIIPFSKYAPRGEVGVVKPPIHLHCVLHAKSWLGGPRQHL